MPVMLEGIKCCVRIEAAGSKCRRRLCDAIHHFHGIRLAEPTIVDTFIEEHKNEIKALQIPGL
jgi:hypothetical protein